MTKNTSLDPARLPPSTRRERLSEHEDRHGQPAATDIDQLTAIVRNGLKHIRYRPALIDGFLAQTGLTLEPESPGPQTPSLQPLWH
jgi:hypothetical protein